MNQNKSIHSQTQLSGRLRLVTTRTWPAALEIGIAQHTTRGTERPLVPMTKFNGVKRIWDEVRLCWSIHDAFIRCKFDNRSRLEDDRLIWSENDVLRYVKVAIENWQPKLCANSNSKKRARDRTTGGT